MGVMRDWSFVEKNECNDQGTRVDPILLVLFNKLVSTKRYINVVSNMSLDDFLTSRYDVTPKRKITGKRYLEFFWNDLCGYQIELHFDIIYHIYFSSKALLANFLSLFVRVSTT